MFFCSISIHSLSGNQSDLPECQSDPRTAFQLPMSKLLRWPQGPLPWPSPVLSLRPLSSVHLRARITGAFVPSKSRLFLFFRALHWLSLFLDTGPSLLIFQIPAEVLLPQRHTPLLIKPLIPLSCIFLFVRWQVYSRCSINTY